MDARVNWMAAAVIAGFILVAAASQLISWFHTRRLDQFAAWIPTIISLVSAGLMTLFYFGLENRRPIVFFGTFLGLVLLPWVTILAIFGPQSWKSSSQRNAEEREQRPLTVTDITQSIPDAVEARLAAYADGTAVATVRYADADAAAASLKAEYGGRLPPLTPLAGREGVLTESGGAGTFQYQDGAQVLRVYGANRAALERRLQTPSPPKPTPLRELSAWLGGVLVYSLFVAWVFLRLASWAASFPPVAGVAPLAAEALRDRLLGVARTAVPFTVWPGDRPDEVIAEWRYADAAWLDHMRAHGMRQLIRYRLRLDEPTRTVRVLEYRASFDASAGLGGANLSFRVERGITFFEVRRETVLGLQVKDGRITPDLGYTWRFSLDELRQPLIKIVTGAGWTWRQVMLDVPWLTG